MKNSVSIIIAILEITVFLVLPVILMFSASTFGLEKTEPKLLEINRPKPPSPLQRGRGRWTHEHDWQTWNSINAFIQEANPSLQDHERKDMSDAIMKWSKHHKVPTGLVVAVCHVESNFRAGAIGPKTKHGRAYGAMQVMWPTHKDLAESYSIDHEQMLSADGGVCVGTRLLKGYIRESGSISGGLSRYYSKPSSRYIIEKIMTSYLTFEQLNSGLISAGEVSKSCQSESEKLKRIVRGR